MGKRAEEIEIEKAAHGWSKLLATWRLCEKAACRRAQACRGAGRACLKAKFPLLPEGVRNWFIGFEGQRVEGFPFEEMLDNLETAGFGQALRDWHDGVGEGAAR